MSNYQPRNGASLDSLDSELNNGGKKSRFNLFRNLNKDGPGVGKDEKPIIDEPTFVNFFKLIGRKINPLLSVNILLVFGNLPIFAFLLAMSGYFSISTTSPLYVVYAPLRGAMLFHQSPAVSALWTLFSRQGAVTVRTTADIVLLAISALTIFTFGPVRVGATYIVRNLLRGEPVFLFHDFFYAIRRNLRQALIYGVLDVLIAGVIVYDIVFFNLNFNVSTLTNIFFYATLCLAVLYFLMRHYIYLMIVTFDLSLFKIFKNALLFTVLGVKRNLLMILGTVLCAVFEYFLLIVYFPLGVIVPFVILPSLLILIGVYAAFPKIKQVMIDPYYEEARKKAGSEETGAEENN